MNSGALADVRGLWPLLPFGNFKFHWITLLQALVPFGSDRAVMNKNVGTISASDEPVALCVIEPLYGSFQTFHAKTPSFRTSLSGGPRRRARLGCIL